MELLNMFENIKIENKERLSKEDLAYCKKQEYIYLTAYEAYDNFLNVIDELQEFDCKELEEIYDINSHAVSYGFDKYDIDKQLSNINRRYISGVKGYFERKYNITISSEKIVDKANTKKINNDFIIDEIFNQLGGFSFEDKATQQIINNFKDFAQYKNVEVKNKKMTMTKVVYTSRWSDGVDYSSHGNLNIIFTTLNHFTNGGYNKDKIYDMSDLRVFGVYELDFEGVESIKLYKNGKIDINFIDGATALKFANTYTNYQG